MGSLRGCARRSSSDLVGRDGVNPSLRFQHLQLVACAPAASPGHLSTHRDSSPCRLQSRRVSWYRHGLDIAIDVARALQFLHSRNIIHFDCKSPNILLRCA